MCGLFSDERPAAACLSIALLWPPCSLAGNLVQTADGRKTWVGVDNFGRNYEELYGPKGWCNASVPGVWVPCIIDGLGGPTCEEVHEHFCIGQCSGHGECYLGFCK